MEKKKKKDKKKVKDLEERIEELEDDNEGIRKKFDRLRK